MNYDVDYFISKFEKIPDSKWCTGVFDDDDKHCANGHCGVTEKNCSDDMPEEATALNMLFNKHGYINTKYRLSDWGPVAIVNDNHDGVYNEPTPKKRILAALRNIKKMNSEPEVQECDATKLPIEQEAGAKKNYIVVKVSETIFEQAKDLILS